MVENYVSIKDLARRWGVTERRVQMLCTAGKLAGAEKIGNMWMIPADVERPVDNRIVTGKHIKSPDKRKKSRNDPTLVTMDILSKVSHDIRTELNGIMGYSDLICAHLGDKATVENYIGNIQISGRRILKVTNNLIDLAKLQSGEDTVVEEACNLETLIEEICSDTCQNTRNKQATVVRRFDLQHKIVYADREKVEKVLGNILENAIEYSGKSGVITILAEEVASENEKCTVNYVIEDNGSGMTDKELRHLYDMTPGFQDPVPDDDDDEEHGFGLGMPLVKQLIDLMQGKIKVESHVGFGTKVTVTLEHTCARRNLTAAEQTVYINTKSLQGKRVLLVEDNEINREAAQELLQSAGLEVDTADDGIMCIVTVRNADPGYYDAILMDLKMPNMDGITATQIIRGLDNEEKRNIPIIAMTASVLSEDKDACTEAGMNGFVEKPMDLKKMLIAIQNCVEG